jgi:hypothetical protein
MVTHDMTLAQRVERTREIYAELGELWPGSTPCVGFHQRPHTEIHEAGFEADAVLTGDVWLVVTTLGTYPFGAMLYGLAERECADCQGLVWKRERPTPVGVAS